MQADHTLTHETMLPIKSNIVDVERLDPVFSPSDWIGVGEQYPPIYFIRHWGFLTLLGSTPRQKDAKTLFVDDKDLNLFLELRAAKPKLVEAIRLSRKRKPLP